MNLIILPPTNFVCSDTNQKNIDKAFIFDGQQISHVKNILQAKVGDMIKIGMQEGNIGTAIICDITEQKISLNNINLHTPPPNKLPLTVILALPRPKVLRRLVMDMTALGVANIILVNSYKTEKSYWQSPMLNRLDEFICEGLQQAVDTVAPNILTFKRFKPFVQDVLPNLIKENQNGYAVVAHPYATHTFNSIVQNKNNGQLPSILCIGAEGGWIEYEIELLKSVGCQSFCMGQRILRTEAAVNVIAGFWIK